MQASSTFYYITVAVGVIATGVAAAGKWVVETAIHVTKFFTEMNGKIDTILNNHLPHINERLDHLEEYARANSTRNERRDREDSSEGGPHIFV